MPNFIILYLLIFQGFPVLLYWLLRHFRILLRAVFYETYRFPRLFTNLAQYNPTFL